MHEVSLCRQLVVAVTRAAGTRHLDAVYIEVGQLRQVVPESLEFAWTFVVRGTPLEHATLHLRVVPACLACDDCAHTTQLGPELGFSCSACGSPSTHLISGEEFMLTAIDIRDDAPAAPSGAPDVAPSVPRGPHHGPLPPS